MLGSFTSLGGGWCLGEGGEGGGKFGLRNFGDDSCCVLLFHLMY